MKRSDTTTNFDPAGFIRDARIDRSRIKKPKKYPFSLPALRSFTKIDLDPKVTFFIGENGSGKSTLVEAIAVAWGLNPEGGSRNFAFATRASHSKPLRPPTACEELLSTARRFLLSSRELLQPGNGDRAAG